jgi:hypothetical protein
MIWESGMMFCLLDAPDRDAVGKLHSKFGIKCGWTTHLKVQRVKRNNKNGVNTRPNAFSVLYPPPIRIIFESHSMTNIGMMMVVVVFVGKLNVVLR